MIETPTQAIPSRSEQQIQYKAGHEEGSVSHGYKRYLKAIVVHQDSNELRVEQTLVDHNELFLFNLTTGYVFR